MPLRTIRQNNQPNIQPTANPRIVLNEKLNWALPLKKFRIESMIAPSMPKESEVANTITLNNPLSCDEFWPMDKGYANPSKVSNLRGRIFEAKRPLWSAWARG